MTKTMTKEKVLLPSKDKAWLKHYTKEQLDYKLPYTTVYDYVYEQNKNHLEDDALYYFDNKWTFKELFEEVDKAAKAFIYLGVNKGKRKDIVTMCTPNTPEAVFAFYALSKIGAVINLIHPLSSHLEIKNYLNEVDSRYFIAYEGTCIKKKKNDKESVIDKINAIIRRTEVEKVIVINPGNYMPKVLKLAYGLNVKLKSNFNFRKDGRYIDWNKFTELSVDVDEIESNVNPDDLFVLFHTGGTTGTPKAVEITHDIFNSAVTQIQIDNPLVRRKDKITLIMPLFHGFGSANCMHLALTSGVGGVLMPKFTYKLFDQMIAKWDPEHFLGVPAVFEAMKNSKQLQNKDLSHWKYLISGGDKISMDLEEQFNKFIKDRNSKEILLKAYGLSEAVAAATRFRKDITQIDGTLKDGTIIEASNVGIPFIKNNFKIIDTESGKELGYNELGEICISGPSVMRGYYKNKKETDLVLKYDKDIKWLHTGDIGFIDELSGCVFFTDRAKRMIITNGYNVYPSQIELFADMLPEIKKSVAIGIPHPKRGELPVLFVTLNDEYLEKDKEQIKELILNVTSRHLPTYAIPKNVVILPAFPLTPMNKVDSEYLIKEYNSLKN